MYFPDQVDWSYFIMPASNCNNIYMYIHIIIAIGIVFFNADILAIPSPEYVKDEFSPLDINFDYW